MLRRTITFVASIALGACASAPPKSITAAPTAGAGASQMAGGYSPVVRIPVSDPNTRAVSAAFFKPEGTGPFPAVIVLGGCRGVGGPHDLAVVKNINSEYLPRGIATLVVDSFTPRGVKDGCDPKVGVPAVAYRAEDAYAALAWLASKPEIDSKQIFIQGYSHGAMAAIEAIGPRRAEAHQQKFAGVIAYYPLCDPRSSFTAPTVILIGEPDAWVPASQCKAIHDKDVDVTVYPNAPHGFAAPGLSETFQGRLEAYDEAAAKDALNRALALIEGLPKPAPLKASVTPEIVIVPSSARAERPLVKVGDKWTFAHRWDWGKLMRSDRTWVVTSIDEGAIKGRENEQPLLLTRDLNSIESPRDKHTDLRFLNFPLEVGKKWSFTDDYVYFNDPNYGRINGRFQINVVVVAYEKLTVTAGEFDAFKIDARGGWNSPQGGAGESHFVYWYAPAARAIVKTELHSTFMPNETSELVELKLQP